MRLLVTGAAGFIGSHFVDAVFENEVAERLAVLDALTYSGNLSTLERFRSNDRFRFYHARVEDPAAVANVVRDEHITHIVNFAAETHNDRSILDSSAFLTTNAIGIDNLLTVARRESIAKVVHVSTDEVYGSIGSGRFTEKSPLEPNTPYSASKAAGDLQCRAHFVTWGTPVVVTRGGNTYGPYQFPEKLIPFFATRLIDAKKVPLYGEGSQVREWIHVRDHAEGILQVLLEGCPGEAYNIGDDNERTNRDIVRILLEETGRDASLVKQIPDPRGGAHDARYSMETLRIRKLGWSPKRVFEQGLRDTVRWYVQNEAWWRPITESEEYKEYVANYYGRTLGSDL